MGAIAHALGRMERFVWRDPKTHAKSRSREGSGGNADVERRFDALAPLPGCGDVGGVGFRWCRCARPPATGWHPSGMPAGAGNAVRGRMWMLGESLRTSADICG